jgi:hypothetical protein
MLNIKIVDNQDTVYLPRYYVAIKLRRVGRVTSHENL